MSCDPGLCTARACQNYSGQFGDEFTITQDNYHISSTNFPILTIDGATRDSDKFSSLRFHNTGNINSDYYISIEDNKLNVENNPGNFTIYQSVINNFPFVIGVSIAENSPSNSIVKYYKEDKYLITLPTVASGQLVSICFTRLVSFPVNNTFIPSIGLSTKLILPQININGQTLIDGSDVGDMIFTIKDKYDYYGKVVDRSCQAVECIDQNLLKTTIFEQCCPKMVSVIKGDFPTLQEKLEQLWLKYDLLPTIYFRDFYNNIILFGMAKYILSRLLYGYFDINFLLWQYNSQFLKDLGNSRFCNFVQFFEQPQFTNYQNYFKYK